MTNQVYDFIFYYLCMICAYECGCIHAAMLMGAQRIQFCLFTVGSRDHPQEVRFVSFKQSYWPKFKISILIVIEIT